MVGSHQWRVGTEPEFESSLYHREREREAWVEEGLLPVGTMIRV